MKKQHSPLFALPLLLFNACHDSNPSKPNIIILFADDMGWADVGFQQEKFMTPNLDSLQSTGVFFENARVSAPTCSPSRASILTGKHAAGLQFFRHIPSYDTTKGFDWEGRASVPLNLWAGDPAQIPSKNWLDLEETTYAELLKEQGYYNAFFGKWHLGEHEFSPVNQGFDEEHFVTPWGAPTRYYPPYFSRWEDYPYPGDSTKTYITDSITAGVIDFINNYSDEKPFQLSLFYYNVHHPHQGKKKWVEKYRNMGYSETMAQYAGMISALDESVGLIMKALKNNNMIENTVIIFTSDQGGAFDNPPFSGGKMTNTLYEGGTRVPLLINYSNVFGPDTISTPVFTYDLLPTLLSLAEGESQDLSHLDGKDLLPLIDGDTEYLNERPVVSYRGYENQYISLLDGQWKAVGYRDGGFELFDLEADPAETLDMSDNYPEKVQQYIFSIKEWEKSMGIEKYSGF